MEVRKDTGGWLSDPGNQWKLGESLGKSRLYSLQKSLSKFPAGFIWLGNVSAGIFLPIHRDAWIAGLSVERSPPSAFPTSHLLEALSGIPGRKLNSVLVLFPLMDRLSLSGPLSERRCSWEQGIIKEGQFLEGPL